MRDWMNFLQYYPEFHTSAFLVVTFVYFETFPARTNISCSSSIETDMLAASIISLTLIYICQKENQQKQGCIWCQTLYRNEN